MINYTFDIFEVVGDNFLLFLTHLTKLDNGILILKYFVHACQHW